MGLTSGIGYRLLGAIKDVRKMSENHVHKEVSGLGQTHFRSHNAARPAV